MYKKGPLNHPDSTLYQGITDGEEFSRESLMTKFVDRVKKPVLIISAPAA
jgi:hypothetical protein